MVLDKWTLMYINCNELKYIVTATLQAIFNKVVYGSLMRENNHYTCVSSLYSHCQCTVLSLDALQRFSWELKIKNIEIKLWQIQSSSASK